MSYARFCNIFILFLVNCVVQISSVPSFYVKPAETTTKETVTEPAEKTTKKPVTEPAETTTMKPVTAACPSGWTLYPPQQTCLKHYPKHSTYRDAQATCQKSNGNVVTVADNRKSCYVSAFIGNENAFIGVRDSYRNSTLFNQDGTQLTYIQPLSEDHIGKGFCVHMDSGGHWSKIRCFQPHPFVCEIDLHPAEKKNTCPEGWEPYHTENKCMKANDVKMSWDEARAKCQMEGADLVKVMEDNKAEFVKGLEKGNNIYIGLEDKDNDRKMTFVDGTEMTSIFWFHGYTVKKGLCVTLYEKTSRYLELRQVPCGDSAISVCEMDMP